MTDETQHNARDSASDGAQGTERFTVLEIFGLRLEVANPHLAELLTMDARSALKTDIGELAAMPFRASQQAVGAVQDARELRDLSDEAMQATDLPLRPQVPKDAMDAKMRESLRARVAAAGTDLGFRVRPDGVWESPSGLTIVTRVVAGGVSHAAASHFVGEFEAVREKTVGVDGSALFVCETQASADAVKVAIRQRGLHHVTRTVSLTNLNILRDVFAAGQLEHAHAVAVLAPIASIDAGELLDLVSAGGDESTTDPA